MSAVPGQTVAGITALPATFHLVTPDVATRVIYWVIFGIFAFAACIIAAVVFRKRAHTRSHGYCTLAIFCTAATAYLAMAMKGGFEYTIVYSATNTARAVYYARYIDWFITTPLLLLDVLLLSGLAIGTVVWIVFADIAMILTGLFGAVLGSKYKWGWFGIGCFWMLVVFWGLLIHGNRAAYLRAKRIGGVYTLLSVYLVCLWTVYPIVWGFAEGSNTISTHAEAAWYGGLDLATKVVFGFMILLMAEPILTTVRKDEDALNNGLPSLLAAPVNYPLLGITTQVGEKGGLVRRIAPWTAAGAAADATAHTIETHRHESHTHDVEREHTERLVHDGVGGGSPGNVELGALGGPQAGTGAAPVNAHPGPAQPYTQPPGVVDDGQVRTFVAQP